MEPRKYIVGLVFVVLLIWGPLDHSWPAWFAIRIGYLILVPLGTWFLLGWIWRKKMTTHANSAARNTALKFMGILVLATLAGAYFIGRIYVDLQISLYGEEAKATIEKIETRERDDGDRAWTVDLINYTFRTKDGYVFAGVNDANSSETYDLIGPSDAAGNYPNARVQYVRSNPEWHHLKGWVDSVFGIIVRMAIVVVLVAFAYWYVYDCLIRRLREAPLDEQPLDP